MVIHVRISDQQQEQEDEQVQGSPAAKRPRTGAPAGETSGPFKDFKVYSRILCARSRHIAACMNGQWAEAAEQRVELTVANEQQLGDIDLLLKLTYSDSYTRDGGRLLPLAMRLRLAVRADALEFVGAVR